MLLPRLALVVVFTLFLSLTIAYASEPVKQEFLVLPHVESNEDFFTGISLLNVGDGTTHVSLTAYNQNGQVVGNSEDVILSQGARYLSSAADLFGYEIATDISWIKIAYTGELSGFGLMGNEGQLARIPLQGVGKETLILPYVISDDAIFTQVYLEIDKIESKISQYEKSSDRLILMCPYEDAIKVYDEGVKKLIAI